MREEQSGMLEQITLDLLPVLSIVSYLPAIHADRDDVLKSRNFSDVLQYDKDQPGALGNGRGRDHEFDIFVRESLGKLKLHPRAIGGFAGYRSAHRSSDDTVLAEGTASASAGHIVGMQAVKSVATANKVNIWLACAEGTTGGSVEVAYPDIAVDDEHGERYGVQNSSVIGRVVMTQTEPRSMPATADEGSPCVDWSNSFGRERAGLSRTKDSSSSILCSGGQLSSPEGGRDQSA